jgi:hypothetical protein
VRASIGIYFGSSMRVRAIGGSTQYSQWSATVSAVVN